MHPHFEAKGRLEKTSSLKSALPTAKMTLGNPMIKHPFFALVLFAAAFACFCANGWSLTVTPSSWESTALPGTSISADTELFNETASSVAVRVELRESSVPSAIAPSTWLYPGKKRFSLRPGQKERFPFSVRISSTAESARGQLAARIAFVLETTTGTPAETEKHLEVLLTIKGTEQRTGTVTNFSIRMENGWLQAAVTLQNSGNVSFRPSGEVLFFDRKDSPRGKVPLSVQRPVFPGQTRTYFSGSQLTEWKDGEYRARLRLHAADALHEKDCYFRFRRKVGVEILSPEKAGKIWRQ